MSMIGRFRRISHSKLHRLLATPDSLGEFIFPEGDIDIDDSAQEDDAFADLDIDKSWHAIHFLLTRTAWEGEPPLDFIVRGGRAIGDEDFGYGPVRAFTPDEVREIATRLEAIRGEDFAARFDGPAMDRLDIYPSVANGWTDLTADGGERVAYFVDYYEALREFLRGAATQREALLVFIT